jgi:hypothetical protein
MVRRAARHGPSGESSSTSAPAQHRDSNDGYYSTAHWPYPIDCLTSIADRYADAAHHAPRFTG